MRNTLTSTAFTPGPWQVDRISPHSPITIKPIPGRIVCDIDGTDGEAEANARLIAAAPELLEMCQAMLMDAQSMAEDSERGLHWDWSLTVENLCRLINKIDGTKD